MPKNQKTLIAIIASIILIAIALTFIIFNNQNRDSNSNSMSSSSSMKSNSSMESNPPNPTENGTSDPIVVTPPNLNLPNPNPPSSESNPSNTRQSVPEVASMPVSTGIVTSLPENSVNSTAIATSLPTNSVSEPVPPVR